MPCHVDINLKIVLSCRFGMFNLIFVKGLPATEIRNISESSIKIYRLKELIFHCPRLITNRLLPYLGDNYFIML